MMNMMSSLNLSSIPLIPVPRPSPAHVAGGASASQSKRLVCVNNWRRRRSKSCQAKHPNESRARRGAQKSLKGLRKNNEQMARPDSVKYQGSELSKRVLADANRWIEEQAARSDSP